MFVNGKCCDVNYLIVWISRSEFLEAMAHFGIRNFFNSLFFYHDIAMKLSIAENDDKYPFEILNDIFLAI